MPSSHSVLAPERGRFSPRSVGFRKATVLGTGMCVPTNAVSNERFSREFGLDTTPEWIERRIGVTERRWCENESTCDLAEGAARAALDRAGLRGRDVDLIVVATSTPDYTMPTAACLVQNRIGATRAIAFDVVNACAGFVFAFDVATRYLQSSDVRTALVIGVDRGSRLIDLRDRGTSVFFGDGAGAAVVGSQGDGRALASRFRSRGAAEPLSVPVGGTMIMDGKAVWNFATEVLPATVRQLCRTARIAVEQIDLLVPHQANRNILVASAAELKMPLDRVAINIDRYGNTLAASIPIALHESLSAGRARDGDKVALVGFGAGLAWGGLLLQL